MLCQIVLTFFLLESLKAVRTYSILGMNNISIYIFQNMYIHIDNIWKIEIKLKEQRSFLLHESLGSTAIPETQVSQNMKDNEDDCHRQYVRPEVTFVKVVSIQNLGSLGDARQFRALGFACCK